MDRLYSRFPGGGVGFGLLLLRIIVAAWFFETGIPMFSVSPTTFFFALVFMSVAVLLIAGAETSANATIGAVCCIGLLLRGILDDQWFSVLSLAVLSRMVQIFELLEIIVGKPLALRGSHSEMRAVSMYHEVIQNWGTTAGSR